MSAARRWSVQEMEMLTEIRSRLSSEIAQAGQYPEVVGDRAIIRFIRGHNHVIDKATEMYASFLNWRKESNADEARDNIVKGGMNDPMKFPFGENLFSFPFSPIQSLPRYLTLFVSLSLSVFVSSSVHFLRTRNH
jgi:hypothetical protein